LNVAATVCFVACSIVSEADGVLDRLNVWQICRMEVKVSDMRKKRLWELLLDRGIFETRKEAESWIMMGRVYVDGQRIDKSGEEVPAYSQVHVKGIQKRYVSRGGLKLEGAIRDFDLDVAARIAIDVGASTGGFTDCLLQHGARKVYAVDVGYGQLAGRLRNDMRVVNMEKVNIAEVQPKDLNPMPNLATIDLSYLSLKTAIPIVLNLIAKPGDIVCLVKPLFEVEDSEIRRTGRIEDPEIYRDILYDLTDFAKGLGLNVIGVTNSPIRGNGGTREFFVRICTDIFMQLKKSIGIQIEESVRNAMELELFG
jgi:23S rRNA (cytidine1920-2'-O)/16S rRNA (cytidine1409-2'-O)-methyltransferase